ncbi:MAG: cation:proton antiporter [Chloroflexi bacterium]|nr:cation:proton antiporter [Chloroflexota bacterium]
MPDVSLVLSLSLAVLAAFLLGLVAQRMGLPVILGYLVAGIAIGPFNPVLHADQHDVQVLAEIGVMFLLFAVGAEFSLRELRHLGRIVVLGGIGQIALTMAIGPFVGSFLGLTLAQGILLGALVALSSTVVVIKVLMTRGELQSLHGRIALGILILQDIAVVPMVVILPAFAAGGEDVVFDLLLLAGKAAAVCIGAYFIGARVAHWLLTHIAHGESRELLILSVVAIALGTAFLAQFVGLSLAFGAFLAGLVVAESEFRTQVVAEIVPLRDLFASLFFVSIGMLFDPVWLIGNLGAVGLTVAGAVLGKVVILMILLLLLRVPAHAAVCAALSLGQVGEFSFVLAQISVGAGALPSGIFNLVISTALISIFLTPFLLLLEPPLLRLLRALPVIGGRFAEPDIAPYWEGLFRGHAVICGFGRVGRELAEALDLQNIHYVIVEYNPLTVSELRDKGVPVVFGDAGSPAVLAHAKLEDASLLAVLVHDDVAAEVAVRHARILNPGLDIIARASSREAIQRLREAGASDVVQPEFEAGVEVIQHVFQKFEIHGEELEQLVGERRSAFYRHWEGP